MRVARGRYWMATKIDVFMLTGRMPAPTMEGGYAVWQDLDLRQFRKPPPIKTNVVASAWVRPRRQRGTR